MTKTGSRARTTGALVIIAALVSAAPLAAQAWSYPSFQTPRIVDRDYNVGVATAGHAGTSVVFQWREGVSPRSQLSLDVGIANPDVPRAKNHLLIGGQYAYQLSTSSAELPLDFLLTAGLYGAVGDGSSLIRVPFGLSIGHRFPLEDGFAITPYIHPRLSLDFCGDCSGSSSDLGVDFDLGAKFDITSQLALRASATFGGSNLGYRNNSGFGVSFSWTPPSLSGPRGR